MREAVTPVWHPAPTLADSTPRNSPSPFAGRRRCGHCRRPGASTGRAQSGTQAGSVREPGWLSPEPRPAGPRRAASRRGAARHADTCLPPSAPGQAVPAHHDWRRRPIFRVTRACSYGSDYGSLGIRAAAPGRTCARPGLPSPACRGAGSCGSCAEGGAFGPGGVRRGSAAGRGRRTTRDRARRRCSGAQTTSAASAWLTRPGQPPSDDLPMTRN